MDEENKLVETAKNVYLNPDSNRDTDRLRKRLKALIIEWDRTHGEKRERSMALAIMDAKDEFIEHYNNTVDDGNHTGMREISDEDISDTVMMEAIRQFLSTGELHINKVSNILNYGSTVSVLDEFTSVLSDAMGA